MCVCARSRAAVTALSVTDPELCELRRTRVRTGAGRQWTRSRKTVAGRLQRVWDNDSLRSI